MFFEFGKSAHRIGNKRKGRYRTEVGKIDKNATFRDSVRRFLWFCAIIIQHSRSGMKKKGGRGR